MADSQPNNVPNRYTARVWIPVIGYAFYLLEETRRDPKARSMAPLIVVGIALGVALIFAAAGMVLFPLWSTILATISITIMVAFRSYAIRKDVELQSKNGSDRVRRNIGWAQMQGLTESERWEVFRVVNYQEAWIWSLAMVIGLLVGLSLR